MENNNPLGLDKFQLTIIKGNCNSIKPIRKLVDKAVVKSVALSRKEEEEHEAIVLKYKGKLESLKQEIEVYKNQIEILDKFAKETTEKTCGIALTSEQVMEFISNPLKFTEYKHSLIPQPDLDAEEDAEWEQGLTSGELKEAI